MEPPTGVWSTIWNFICFLPFFIGLLILGVIKGIIMFPIVCLIVTLGISAIIVGLLPVHIVWTYYTILRTKMIGPVLKLVLCVILPVPLVLWPVVAIIASFIGGMAFGIFSPILATFKAVGEGKEDKFLHCISDGTWDTVQKSCTVVRDVLDVCYHSYFSVMDDLYLERPSDGQYYEIRLLYLPGAILISVLGFAVDFPIITAIAVCKSPYMLFKGWHRLLHDLKGREGPFLETICVPFAGLIILLWPLAVLGSVLASMLSSIFIGAFAGVVVYQESSPWSGLCYIVASLSIFDEYTNDVLDMPEGSCFPRPRYRKEGLLSRTTSSASVSLSRQGSFRSTPSHAGSVRSPMIELKPLELLDSLFKESQQHGEALVTDGLVTSKDIEDSKSSKDTARVLSVGLPAYCILQALLRSAKSDSIGILSSDGTEITTTNRPKDSIFDWLLNPLLIIKDQIKATHLLEIEEHYLCQLVMLNGDPERLKSSFVGSQLIPEIKRAELEAMARRLQGITKSISRFPTFKRRVEELINAISEDFAKKSRSNERPRYRRSKSAIGRLFTQNSFSNKGSKRRSSDPESQHVLERDVDIEDIEG